jgi:hypothetical protein
MGTPAAAPESAGTRSGTNPVLIVAGTLVTVLAVTLVIYSVGDYEGQDGFAGGSAALAPQASAGACGQGTPADPGYTVDVAATPDPPRPEGTSLLLTVRRGGRPVTGAKVCVAADMPEMQHPGLSAVARESSGGRYETRIQFGMGGTWRTSVIVAEPDRPVVAIPLTIQVAEIESN